MAAFKPQYEFPDELVQSLARKLGISELTDFRGEELSSLEAAEATKVRKAVKALIFDALDLVATGAPAPIPQNAIVLDDKHKHAFFEDLARRTVPNEAKGERRAPAEVLAERFRKNVGDPVFLTLAELAEEALRVYHEQGKKSKTIRDVVFESISSRCQSQISNHLQAQYGSLKSVRRRDYSHLELAYALLQASLEGKKEIVWHNDGTRDTYTVPAWEVDENGSGYRNQYKVITPTYILKACEMAPVNHRTNLAKVKDWIRESCVQGITDKVKGKK